MNKKKSQNFVMLDRDILYGKVYTDLPHSAARLVPYFRGKVKCANQDNKLYRETFEFTYREAKYLGFSASTFSKGIKSLVSHGFIDRVRVGNCFGDVKNSSIYRLSQRWKLYGNPEFIESDREMLNTSIQREAGR